MKVQRFEDVDDFAALAVPFLARHEAANNLPLGIIADLGRGGSYSAGKPYLALALEGRDIAAVAVRTPPFGLVLSDTDSPAAIGSIAEDAASIHPDMPSVVAGAESARRFAAHWKALTGRSYRVMLNQRIYQCSEVITPPGIPGRMREMRDDEYDFVLEWTKAFNEESHAAIWARTDDDYRVVIDMRRKTPEGGFFFWEVDGVKVSISGCGGSTPNGIRIGPVYTPPEARNHGYGTALVAALTSRLLSRGMKFCFLFTDLANPVSNSIYGKVGYVPVTDADLYAFEEGTLT